MNEGSIREAVARDECLSGAGAEVIHGTYIIVVYYSNTCHAFPRHLHHDMTTEDTLQYSKMGRSVANSMMVVEAPMWFLAAEELRLQGSGITRWPLV
jgi:hypothetical protein